MRSVALRVSLAAAVVVLAGCAGAAGSEEHRTLLVAAASDLRPAFEVLGDRFADDSGVQVTFDFGSSGQLAQRIVEGAPVDLFASADAALVDEVVAAGVAHQNTRRTYAYGRIVIWAGQDAWGGWQSLEDLAADEEVATVAIANPEHAPYGAAAAEAIDATGVADALAGRLVLGENVSDAQRLVESGNADAGVIALSLALAADERGVGRWVEVAADLHEPLQQDLVVTSGDPDRAADARAFAALVDGDEGRAVMRRFGFLLPGDGGP